MTFHKQDRYRDCGHIAVAALTDIPLSDVKMVINKRGGTTTKHLAKALRQFGYNCPDKCIPMKIDSSMFFGLAQLHDPEMPGWHWVAIGEGIVYDGNRSGPMLFANYVNYQKKANKAKLTSFLPVQKIALI